MRPSPHRIPLNPCDYLFLAHHRLTERRIRGGNVAFMTVDLDGWIAPAALRAALARALAAHPAVGSTLRFTLVRSRPHWRALRGPDEIAKAAARAHVFHDLRDRPDAPATLERLCAEHFSPHWSAFALGPQVRLEHYALPQRRTRLVLRWPHCLMDAEGAQWLLAEIHRLGTSSTPDDLAAASTGSLSPGLSADHQPLDPLAGTTLSERIRLMRSAPPRPKSRRGQDAALLSAGPRDRIRRYAYLHRLWPADDGPRLTDLAKRRAPGGPGLHARYLAAAVVRALDRLHAERGIRTTVYRIPLPIRAARSGPDAVHPQTRPLTGNYLAAPTVSIPRDLVGDWPALGESILAQFDGYLKSGAHRADWATLWLAAQLGPRQFEWALALPTGLPDFSTGYSYYGEIDPPLRTILGCAVTNIWGCAPMAIPPGLNPAFSRFDDRLNLSLAWAEPHIDPAWAQRFADLIEQEALDRR